MRSLIPLTLMLLPSGVTGQPANVTSAYTKLDLDSCQFIDKGDEPGWMEWRCAGYASLALFVQNGDDRYDLDAGIEVEDPTFGPTFDYPGDTVEWRLFNGTPFAIIYRLKNADPDRPPASVLIVESVGRGTKPGCRVAAIDGATKDANVQARRAADALLVKPAVCLTND